MSVGEKRESDIKAKLRRYAMEDFRNGEGAMRCQHHLVGSVYVAKLARLKLKFNLNKFNAGPDNSASFVFVGFTMALPTRGRVIISTTAGEIDIELWSKETPKACRNFLALAMEGYYDGVIFHRIVPGFLVQTGDRTGTGAGGESFYGEPFEDEIHPRLRFAHRGLVGMANAGKRHTNDSQFFITLDRADELHGKHTLFGRVMGDTIFNVLKIGEMEIDKEGRPVYPPKIKSVRIVDNPFDDIVPRITAAEKRAQQRAREEAQREREEQERRKGAKKNVKLLSFGADEDTAEEPVTFQKKAIYRPDLEDVASPAAPDFIAQPSPRSRPSEEPSGAKSEVKVDKPSKKKDESDITKIREKHAQEQAAAKNARSAEIEKMEAEIRRLTKRREGEDSDEERTKKKAKKSYLELAKYAKGRGLHSKGKRRDEGDVLAALNSFRGKLKSSAMMAGDEGDADADESSKVAGEEAKVLEGGEDAGMEVDDDRGFLTHALHFPKDDGEESRKAERDYEVIDPRQRGAKAKEEERERKRLAKAKGGGGGRRR
ncbi:putative PPIases accelerate the folding of proteins [Lyophyllum shimeji]|uniref:Peptidyl-prolyl isomerase CWC27 n=1 Tax=Lyophyllum shimeji TaxID=47721 RepID=A0A9P3PXE0_LYOSH|nr:putative PPIases accelerate the folding of proteins [Lyophyllum shimeji]